MLKADSPIVITAVAVLICAPASLRAGQHIDIEKLPENVVKAIQERLPGAQLLSAEKERDDGKIEYEVKIQHDGNKYEVELTEDGRIKEIDREDD
jgi:hemin uptake protein HemP